MAIEKGRKQQRLNAFETLQPSRRLLFLLLPHLPPLVYTLEIVFLHLSILFWLAPGSKPASDNQSEREIVFYHYQHQQVLPSFDDSRQLHQTITPSSCRRTFDEYKCKDDATPLDRREYTDFKYWKSRDRRIKDIINNHAFFILNHSNPFAPIPRTS